MNIGMITAGALYLGPLRRELIRNGNRCQSFAFASTFFAGAARIGYDLVVVNWSVLAQDGQDVIKRLRRLAGDVEVLVVQVPHRAEIDEHDPLVHWYRGPVTTQGMLDAVERSYAADSSTVSPIQAVIGHGLKLIQPTLTRSAHAH
ncbi:MAG: hypothetical protein H6981_01495 [Gammaproteobacteria bacterium]|nr:hypothetical protein [Gammaproteobacteria bacterium]MCP5135461.1 hypothetical protein [Gammaproteobacteria bacterium]